ncbi:hypothetical protein J6590_082609 [Homalodisca vitripennis]|nr:hypothetical protein J6590_082609 [Homalodisca vitripennis]
MKLTVLLCCLAAVLYTASSFPSYAPPPTRYDNPRQRKVRGALHAAYHEIQYHRTGNQREHERAKDQWGVVSGGSRDNLERYDREHYGSGK